jgi:hypothetical protein
MEASRIAAEIRERVGPGISDPVEIHFEFDEVGIGVVEEKVVGHFSVDLRKLEGMIVIGELETCLVGCFSGSIEHLGHARPDAGLLACLFIDE